MRRALKAYPAYSTGVDGAGQIRSWGCVVDAEAEEFGRLPETGRHPWLGKAKKVGHPPQPSETTGSLGRAEPARGYGREDGLTQLNFKIPHSTKKRIKQLAVRDNITLLTMLDRMLELYEKEHGKLSVK